MKARSIAALIAFAGSLAAAGAQAQTPGKRPRSTQSV